MRGYYSNNRTYMQKYILFLWKPIARLFARTSPKAPVTLTIEQAITTKKLVRFSFWKKDNTWRDAIGVLIGTNKAGNVLFEDAENDNAIRSFRRESLITGFVIA
ncbi:MAG: hypothetical protein ACRCXN_12980 [Bacteroidales bacterium]